MRFEEPNSNQRWDSPLFVTHPEDELPYDQISDALFNRKPPPPNMATQNVISIYIKLSISVSNVYLNLNILQQPLSSTNFLYELDRVTQETVSVSM